MEAVALRGPCRVCMIDTEISNTFLESSDIVLSLVPDQNWYLKVDQISPTLINNVEVASFHDASFHTYDEDQRIYETIEIRVIMRTISFIDQARNAEISTSCGLRYGETLIGKKHIL